MSDPSLAVARSPFVFRADFFRAIESFGASAIFPIAIRPLEFGPFALRALRFAPLATLLLDATLSLLAAPTVAEAAEAERRAQTRPKASSGTTSTTPGPRSILPAEPSSGVRGEWTLPALIDLSLQSSPALLAAAARREGAGAGVTTAGAWPNPEIDGMVGRHRARAPGVADGRVTSFGVAQPLEWPGQRSARIDAAEQGLAVAAIELDMARAELIGRIAGEFDRLLRLHAEIDNARVNADIARQVRDRVEVRVRVGESPRYELIRADAEWLDAQRRLQAAQLVLAQGHDALRRQVGIQLPAGFSIRGTLDDSLQPLPDFDTLLHEVMTFNADVRQARAQIELARAERDHARTQRYPDLSVRGFVEREPEIISGQIGLAVRVPLFDRRQGPIRQAEARLTESQASLRNVELAVESELRRLWTQHEIARGNVDALRSGMLVSAGKALDVSEAAYRQGEKGILEFLDAQRTYRNSRSDLTSALHERRTSRHEIERLRGFPAGLN